ncbi:importin-13-like isoform X2 [Zophobas morio]|uniref:importin-13-like isoform X2 n=1 Tax=Zophobas morio TaxID=2755281 RepID=UPI003083E788
MKLLKQSKVVKRNLIVALSNYMLRTVPFLWHNCLEELLDIFSVDEESTCDLLELLTIFREDFNKRTLTKEQRSQIHGYFTLKLPWLFNFIKEVLASTFGAEAKKEALHCLGAWASFCPSSDLLLPINCLPYAFEFLYVEDLLLPAVNAIETVFIQPDVEDYTSALLELLPLLTRTRTLYCLSLADTDKCLAFCRLLVAFVCCPRLMVIAYTHERSREVVVQLLDYMLLCTGHPINIAHEEVSQHTLEAWYDLLEAFSRLQDIPPQIFSVLCRLLHVIAGKVQLPGDSELLLWKEDDHAQFKKCRSFFGQTVGYLYCALGKHSLRELTNIYLSGLESNHWQQVHGAIYCLRALSDSCEATSETALVIGDFLLSLTSVFERFNVYLQQEALLACGAFSEWLLTRPEVISSVVKYIILCLNSDEILARSASLALNNVAEHCSPLLVSLLESVIEPVMHALYQRNHPPSMLRLIASAMVHVLHHLEQPRANGFLVVLVGPAIRYLKLDTQHVEQVMMMKMLSIIKVVCENYRPLLTSHASADIPSHTLCQELIPLLEGYWGSRLSYDPEFLECICGIAQGLVESMSTHFAPFLRRLISSSFKRYKESPSHFIVKVYSCILRTFKDKQYEKEMSVFFCELAEVTFYDFKKDARVDPELTEAYLRLVTETLQKGNGDIVYSSNVRGHVYDLCLVILHYPETNLLKASCACLTQLLKYARSGQYQHEQCPRIVPVLLECVTVRAPRTLMHHIANLFHQLDLNTLQGCLRSVLAGLTPAHVKRGDVEMFAASILTKKNSKASLTKLFCNYADLCRSVP